MAKRDFIDRQRSPLQVLRLACWQSEQSWVAKCVTTRMPKRISVPTWHPVSVIADDAVALHVEVDDDRAPSVTDDLTVIFCHGYSLNQDSWHYQRRDLRPLPARLRGSTCPWEVDEG